MAQPAVHPSPEPAHRPIAAKLRAPRPLTPVVPRPRVDALLRAAVDRSFVVFLAGPSGIGKTVALTRWAAGATGPVAWVTLDNRDNDPRRLWPHVAAALGRATGDPGLESAIEGPDPGSDAYVAALADRIVAHKPHEPHEPHGPLDTRPVLILDEYEHIVERDIHDRLDLLTRICADRLTLVIAARSRPPIPVERLGPAGRLAVLSWTQLRFDHDEAHELFTDGYRLDLTHDDTRELLAATDGWASGLTLAAIRLRDGAAPDAVVAALHRGDPTTTDYLLDHVWRELDSEMREFVLETAVLPRFTVPLADAVRGRTDSADFVDRLRRDGLFLADTDGVLHYQRLFRRSLAQRLDTGDPERAGRLHRRAAHQHARHGRPEEAVEHALAARDHHLAADLLDRHFDHWFAAGHLVTLEQWLGALPDEAIVLAPRLHERALNLWCSLGRFDERDRWDRARRPGTERELHAANAWRLCLPREQGDFGSALRRSRALLAADERTLGIVWTQVRISVARTLLLAGRLGECVRLLTEIETARTDPPPPAPLRVTLHGLSGLAAHLAGDSAGARRRAAEVERALAECRSRPRPRAVPETVILRALLAPDPTPARPGDTPDGPDLLAALIDADPGLGNDRSMAVFASLLLARTLGERGDHTAARHRLAAADTLLARCPTPLGLIDLRDAVAAENHVHPDGPDPIGLHTAEPGREPLSERESTIAQYLRSDLTLREVAADLYISINTMKTHTRHIYRKLGITGRHDLLTPGLGRITPSPTPTHP
ncbi:LuxR C-terminal-related transcriptional regulator [Embleya sp. NPDC020886]|uniref:helix-turn-helix transcriptional regulator n=1 Tax=Embleya sp. NPDC020886 TaxID=3363980 RepID=UPI0037887B11